jgi:hypothetical protein
MRHNAYETTTSPGTRTLWAFAAWATLLSALAGGPHASGRAADVAAAALTFAAFAGLSLWRSRGGTPGRAARAVLLAAPAVLVAAPGAWWAARAMSGDVLPVEAAVLATCRNLMLALAAAGSPARRQWAWGAGVAVCIAAGLYVDERLCAAAYVGTCAFGCVALLAGAGGAHRTPRRAAVATTAVVVASSIAAYAALGPDEHLSGRRGFVPASGGTGAGAEHAARGVGDGPDVIDATRDARSIGFDRSNVFANSEELGLYDAFVENFGAPLPPPGRHQKMVNLRQDQVVESHEQAAMDLRQGRTFALRRAAPPAAAKSPAAARALLWVTADGRGTSACGRTTASTAPPGTRRPPTPRASRCTTSTTRRGWCRSTSRTAPRSGRPWRRRSRPAPTPTPCCRCRVVTGFKLGRVDRTDFFAPAQPGLLRLHDRAVPAGSVLDVPPPPA